MGKTKKQKVADEKTGADASTAGATKAQQGRLYTTSIAIPGSVVESAASIEVAGAIAAQIARSCIACCVDEVVVYDDTPSGPSGAPTTHVSSATAFLAKALQYMETPPYLRQELCSSYSQAEVAALEAQSPLHAPHHLGQTEWQPYREGVVLKCSEAGVAASDGKGSSGSSFVDVGLDRMAHLPQPLPVGMRVTVSVGEEPTTRFMAEYSETMVIGEAVPPSTPRTERGQYWGFSVRVANSLHRAVKDAPFKGGYDLMIGTSAQGIQRGLSDLVLPRFAHLLLLFGGAVKGLAEIMEGEEALGGKTPEDYFNMYLNVCPDQGARSIRSEDALPLALGYLRPAVLEYGGRAPSKR